MSKQVRRVMAAAAALGVVLVPGSAHAQSTDGWQFDVVPFYVWAASLDGTLGAGPITAPVNLDFSTLADHLSSAFSFHVEVRKGRWGALADVFFVGLSSRADVVDLGGLAVTGEADLDNVIVDVGGSFRVHNGANLAVIGGLRTYTLAPTITFSTPTASATPVDTSETSANAFVGLTLRPRLSEGWTLLTRGDVGGGDANYTWSAEVGLGYRFWRWMGVAFGVKGLGIDIANDDLVVREYDVVQYGPYAGIDLHWGSQ